MTTNAPSKEALETARATWNKQIENLSDRRGLGSAFFGIDEDVLDEINETMTSIIAQALDARDVPTEEDVRMYLRTGVVDAKPDEHAYFELGFRACHRWIVKRMKGGK